MRSFARVALAAAVAVCVSGVASAAAVKPTPLGRPMWGALGHSLTAAIAQGFLSANATQGCQNLLPDVDGDIAQIASWADTVARDLYPWSPQLHYINTPDWACNYQQSRDCVGEDGSPMACVDGAIQNFTAQVVTGQYDGQTLAAEQITEALMFVVHFIGDIHQPLHVGFTSDEGGNKEYGTFEGTSNRRLHQVWDEDMIEKRLNDDFGGSNITYLQYFVNNLQGNGIFASKVSQWRQCNNTAEPNEACSIEWANQSVVLACSTAYTDQDGNKIQDGFDLEDPYYNFAYPVAEMQLAAGGIRLANVLNSIFSAPTTAHYILPRQQFLEHQRKHARHAAGVALM